MPVSLIKRHVKSDTTKADRWLLSHECEAVIKLFYSTSHLSQRENLRLMFLLVVVETEPSLYLIIFRKRTASVSVCLRLNFLIKAVNETSLSLSFSLSLSVCLPASLCPCLCDCLSH